MQGVFIIHLVLIEENYIVMYIFNLLFCTSIDKVI